MIAVVDYHKGNIRSVVRGLEAAGADVLVTDDPAGLKNARGIVMPGVGAFSDAMDSLDNLELTPALTNALNKGMPYLGICLGMHVLFDAGTEHAPENSPRKGLGFLPGVVEAMPKEGVDADGNLAKFKLPHVGWNEVSFKDSGAVPALFEGINPGEYFYFTHSYISPENPYTVGETTHSVTFPSVVQRDNIWGVQFHPEKSSTAGAKLLENFVNQL